MVLGDRHDPRMRRLDVAAVPASVPGDVRFVFGERPEDFGDALADAEVVLAWWRGREALDPVLAGARRLRWIHSSAAGLDHLLSPALATALASVSSPSGGATLTNSRGVYGEALGEYVLGAMLFFAKDMARLRDAQARRTWDPFEGERIAGKVLGIVGYGDIGREIAKRALPFGVEVVGFRRRDPGVPEPYVTRMARDLRDVLGACHYVVLAMPLTPATERFIGAAELAWMRRDAVLINIGRGRLIDEPALVAALQSGALRGAALDVFEREPLPAEHAFWGMRNVLLSPHSADRVDGWLDRTMDLFLANLGRFLRGEPLVNVVDVARGY